MDPCHVIIGPLHGRGILPVCGENVEVHRGVMVDTSAAVVIGENIIIGDGVRIFTHKHDLRDPWAQDKIEFTPLVIEDNVWLMTGAIVQGGVKRIGTGARIAAGAVVTREVEPNTFVGGVPATLIERL